MNNAAEGTELGPLLKWDSTTHFAVVAANSVGSDTDLKTVLQT